MTANYSFRHLLRLSDDHGLFEHAEFGAARTEHGYCVDDVARGLVAIARERQPLPELKVQAHIYLRFLVAAQTRDGRSRNRMNAAGRWTDQPGLEDCWGRSLWALGSAAARMPALQDAALAAFNRGAKRRSPELHAMCFAGLGAAEVLAVDATNTMARQLLRSAAKAIAIPGNNTQWPWPETRLRYANAAIPQVLLLAGQLLDESRWLQAGLSMLRWLVDIETRDGHISVTPVGGWALGEPRPGFDQQPIEVATLADACRTAFDITNDVRWLHTIEACAAWFDGDNDVRIPMTDDAHSVGFDGLHAAGRNQNRGAESTLAMLSTFQQLQRIPVAS